MMRKIILAALFAASLGGCAGIERDNVTDRENLLSAGGFRVLPVNTPERQAELAKLPPNRVVQQIMGEHVSYLYADPLVCHCLYAGGQDAFGRYQSLLQQRRIASDQLLASEQNQDFGFGYGAFGGFGPAFY